MIAAYHRPQQKEEALALLGRKSPRTVVLAGGLSVNQASPGDAFEVVDIQALGLGGITSRGNSLILGAAVTLQTLLDSSEIFPALQEAVRRQDAYNRRQVATVAGSLLAGDGRSPFAAAFYALDPVLVIEAAGQEPIERHLGDIYALGEGELEGKLITACLVPTNLSLAYRAVARTPADRPLVCAAVSQWASGRTRVILGGHGPRPILALDGPTSDGAARAARDAYSEAEDQWASAEYRAEAAEVLVQRCVNEIEGAKIEGEV